MKQWPNVRRNDQLTNSRSPENPKLINTKKIPRHVIVKLLKNKDKDKGSPLMSIISTELSATMAFLFLHYSN